MLKANIISTRSCFKCCWVTKAMECSWSSEASYKMFWRQDSTRHHVCSVVFVIFVIGFWYRYIHVIASYLFCVVFNSWRVEIMMGCGNKLVKPALSAGQSLSGYIINKIFGCKAIYLRPSTDLIQIKVRLLLSKMFMYIYIYCCIHVLF